MAFISYVFMCFPHWLDATIEFSTMAVAKGLRFKMSCVNSWWPWPRETYLFKATNWNRPYWKITTTYMKANQKPQNHPKVAFPVSTHWRSSFQPITFLSVICFISMFPRAKKNNVRRSSMLTTKAEKGQTLNSVSWMTVEWWIGGAMAMLVVGLVYPISNNF